MENSFKNTKFTWKIKQENMKIIELRIQIKIEAPHDGNYHLEKAIDGIRNAGLEEEIIKSYKVEL